MPETCNCCRSLTAIVASASLAIIVYLPVSFLQTVHEHPSAVCLSQSILSVADVIFEVPTGASVLNSPAFGHVLQCGVAVPKFVGIFFWRGVVHHSIAAPHPLQVPSPSNL